MENKKCPPRGRFSGGFRGGRGGSLFGARSRDQDHSRSRDRDRSRSRDRAHSRSPDRDHDSRVMESRAEKGSAESNTVIESSKGTISSTSGRQSGVIGLMDKEVKELLKHRDKMAASVEVIIKQLTEAQMRELLHHIVNKQPGIVLDALQLMDQVAEPGSALGPPSWCTCKNCRTMPTAEENVCCGHRPELCLAQMPDMDIKLQPFLLELQHRRQNETPAFNIGKDDAKRKTKREKIKIDIVVNDNAAKREAAYRMFVYWWRGTLGAGNTVVIPSCVVLHVRAKYPDTFNNYAQDSTRIVLFGKKLFEN